MKTLVPIQRAYKTQAVAHSLPQSQRNTSPTFQFADHRPESAVQRKLVEMIHQGAASPKFTADEVVQRVINLTDLDATAHGLYHVRAGGSSRLVSTANAPAPEPPALYNVQGDTSREGERLKVWKPRSKLADKHKLSGETPVYNSAHQLITDLSDIEYTVLDELIEEVEAEVNDRRGDRGLRLGTAGINDCKGYAITLRAMIARYGRNPQGLVGRTWIHPTDASVATFPYHGATVVAQDGNDAVTLEAHAGKDLAEPEFHIRHGGKTGFEDANKLDDPGVYESHAVETPAQDFDEATRVIDTLKEAWTDKFGRSDKSSVYESQALPKQSNSHSFLMIGALLFLLIGILYKMSQSVQGK